MLGVRSCSFLRQVALAKKSFPGTSVHLRCVSSYFRDLYPLHDQSSVLSGPERIRRARENKHQYKAAQYFQDVTTVYDGFLRGERESRNGPYLGRRPGPDQPYQWISYSEAGEKARLLGSGFIVLGERPGPESRIGLFSKNRPEWVIADLACVNFSMASVPLYDNIGVEACRHIINQTEMRTLICDNVAKIQFLLGFVEDLPTLKHAILMDDQGITEEMTSHLRLRGIQVMSFDDVIQLGITRLADPTLPRPDTLYTIVYSSGTTGLPKGVSTTHRNIIANHAVTFSNFEKDGMTPEDAHLSYLPLAHIFERAMTVDATIHGGRIGFYRGDPLTLLDDLQTLKPTVFLGVPKVYNKIYQKVQGALRESSPMKQALFRMAYRQKLGLVRRGVVHGNSIWDRLVFRKIQDLFGGRVKLALVGGAPTSPQVTEFFKVVFPLNCVLMEGYGQTEVSACATHTVPHEVDFGHVGVPGGDLELKLIDVPSLGYFAEEDKGEICIRGSNVCSGYFKDPVRTKETFDEEGWLHTGDIGQWTTNGTLKIIDRKGHIFKLSNGEFVAPERIETVYGQHPVVEQAFVYGDPTQSCLVGVFFPNAEEIQKYADKTTIKGQFTELHRNIEITTTILKDLQEHGAKEGLQEFEQIRALYLIDKQFDEKNGLLTPTMKNRRKKIAESYRTEIDRMYDELKTS